MSLGKSKQAHRHPARFCGNPRRVNSIARQPCRVALKFDFSVTIAAANFFKLPVEFATHYMVQFQALKSCLPAVRATGCATSKSVYLPFSPPRSANWVLLFHVAPPLNVRYREKSDSAGSIALSVRPAVRSSTPAIFFPCQTASASRLPRKYRPKSRR